MKLNNYINRDKKAQLAVLIDPDKFNPALVKLCDRSKVSFFLVGGSKLKKNNLNAVVLNIKKRSSKPVFIFPGDETQLSKNADGLLMLSLISGRNAEYLIGKHVRTASLIKKMKLETLPTGYILIDGKNRSSTQKVSQTNGINGNKITEIVDTALAGEMLGLRAIYLEAGSGAKKEVNQKIIKAVKRCCSIPLIVGGGINTYIKAKNAVISGANVVVVGNALEKNIYLLTEIEKAF